MGQKKLKRFAEISTFKNVLERPQGMKGNWAAHFGNANPITLELPVARANMLSASGPYIRKEILLALT